MPVSKKKNTLDKTNIVVKTYMIYIIKLKKLAKYPHLKKTIIVIKRFVTKITYLQKPEYSY